MTEISRTLQEHADWLADHATDVRIFRRVLPERGWFVSWHKDNMVRCRGGSTIKRALAAACEQVRQEHG